MILCHILVAPVQENFKKTQNCCVSTVKTNLAVNQGALYLSALLSQRQEDFSLSLHLSYKEYPAPSGVTPVKGRSTVSTD